PKHFGHETSPKSCRCRRADGLTFRFRGKTKTRKRGHNDVESVFRSTAVADGISERSYSFKEFKNRARPAVSQYERHRLRAISLHMIKMNIQVAHSREELRIP